MVINSRMLFLLFIVSIFILSSCGSSDQTSEQKNEKTTKKPAENQQKGRMEKRVETLKDEAMAIHDEVMPKMDSLIQLRRQLEDLLGQSKSGAQSENIEQVINQLERAEKGMRDWMRRMSRFQDESDTLGLDRQYDFLEREKEAMKKVKERMRESMQDANAVLENEKKGK